APVFDAAYWADNLRHPVQFAGAAAAAGERHGTFVEVSPHPILTHALTDSLAERRGARVLPTLLRDQDEALTFHVHRAQVAGVPVTGAPRIDLPPHTWQHSEYWMSPPAGGTRVSGEHPLLGAHVAVPSGSGDLWSGDVGLAALPWLADHRVHGQAIMPAAGFAEAVLAGAAQAFGVDPAAVTVRRLEVEQMLPLADSVRLTTQLTRTGDATGRVEVFTGDGDTWRRHAVADVAAEAASTGTPVRARSHDSAPVTGDPVAPNDFYTALRRTGAHHDTAFAALTRLIRGDGVAEGEAVLPPTATAHRGLVLHPVLLDAALQTLAAAMPADRLGGAGDDTYLPVSVEEIQVFGVLGRQVTCRASFRSVDSEGALGDVVVLGEDGTLAARVNGVFLRRVQRRTVPLPLAQKMFRAEWLRVEPPTGASTRPGSWLVVGADATEFARSFSSPERRVVTASLGDDAAVSEAFGQAAGDPAMPPVGVVVLVPALQDDVDGTAARDLLWQVTSVVRTVATGWLGEPPRLWLVTREGMAVRADEPGDPGAGALRGLVRVLAYEHAGLRPTLLDVPEDADAAQVLTAETAGADDVVAWRGGERFAARLTRAGDAAVEAGPTVRADGAYIVTGGMGGIGLVVARHLREVGAGRVVLSGRRALDAGDQAEVDALGAEYVQGDLSEPGTAERLVAAAERDGLTLRGVLHSAAVLDDQLVAALTQDALARVWAPKVTGALRLDAAVTDRELDWFVLFSSVASLLGSPGQGAYAAANGYLDALVDRRRAAGLPATSVQWGQWADVGLARSLAIDAVDPMTPAEGLEALDAVLAGTDRAVGVVRLRLDRAAAVFPELKGQGYFAPLVAELDSADDDAWPGLEAVRAMPAAQAREAVLDRLRSRISAVMGYGAGGGIDPAEPLTKLGMDSLMAVRIRNAARADFGIEPPVALLLQGASLTDLAAALATSLGVDEPETDQADAPGSALASRVQQRAAARRRAASRRKETA
ncbi:SDR family NAD(P)-dependent oxidoreductase, partial [Tsukamurella sp. 8J]